MKTPAFLAASSTSLARSSVCLSWAMGFCPMPLILKSAISSIVVPLSRWISAIMHLLRPINRAPTISHAIFQGFLPPVPLRDERIKGHPLQRQVAGVAPLMEGVGGHQHGIPFGDRVLFAITAQGAMPFQDINDVLPGVCVATAVRVADSAWSHGPVVEHHIMGHAVPGVEYPAPGFRVQVPIVADDRHRALVLPPLGAADCPRAAALGGNERVDLDASHDALPTVVQGVMVYTLRDKDGVALPHRVLRAVADQSATALENVDLMLPGMRVVCAGLVGINLRIAHGAGGWVIVERDEAGCPTFWRIATAKISDDGFHSVDLLYQLIGEPPCW